ncbi:MAG TPA: hypothetical protein VEU30_02645 [Thermoanaerobaculia bacterium]|nr:hypothetical protein [Thermoanaerobaculia bacterium]
MGSVSCGCSLAIGLLILGSCAGVAAAGGTQSVSVLKIIIAVVSALVIVTFVYVIARKNAKLKIARAEIEELNRKAAADLVSQDEGESG